MPLQSNIYAPDFSLADDMGELHTLSEFRGKAVILYFYPKDDTPGCTTEAMQFRDRFTEFSGANCRIFGISRDTLKSHDNFRAKLGLPFDLIADTDEAVCRLFDVIKTKNMYGKQVQGIERSTFLLDRAGILRGQWRKVKADGHAEEVLSAVKQLD